MSKRYHPPQSCRLSSRSTPHLHSSNNPEERMDIKAALLFIVCAITAAIFGALISLA